MAEAAVLRRARIRPDRGQEARPKAAKRPKAVRVAGAKALTFSGFDFAVVANMEQLLQLHREYVRRLNRHIVILVLGIDSET